MASSNPVTPVAIEPPTAKEERERQGSHATIAELEADPNFPDEWKKEHKVEKIVKGVDKGFRYLRRNIGEKTYMLLRKGNNDIGLGQFTDEKEGKLFGFFPSLDMLMSSKPKPSPWVATDASGNPRIRGYLSMPINRQATIPRDYVPSIHVIRYFQILKENGFPGDFSQFVNEIVTRHFSVCNGIKLPILLEQEMTMEKEEKEEENLGKSNPN